ncbi:MAG: hypothetical protein V4574_08045 [Pseudomonadota bacterium]
MLDGSGDFDRLVLEASRGSNVSLTLAKLGSIQRLAGTARSGLEGPARMGEEMALFKSRKPW